MTRNKKELELYIHIPFCKRKCAYCDFLSSSQSDEAIEQYIEALICEISASYASEGRSVTSIFLGGGTPSVLEVHQMERIFDAIRSSYEIAKDAEISIEANPGTVSEEKLLCYKKLGINRISFGLQSANDEELKLLGRIHSYAEFLESFHLARKYGFENINVDLISAIPKQTLQSWEETLGKVIALEPEHISAYSLIVEDGTPFAKLYGENGPKESELPCEEEERKIYYRTGEKLKEAGYKRYEISNYSKIGKECRHNIGYWDRKEYLGLGLGASSLVEETRFKNTDSLQRYIQYTFQPSTIREDEVKLTVMNQMEEFMFLGLRKMDGISQRRFLQNFGKDINRIYGLQIQKLIEEGLLERVGDNLRLTEHGIDVSNYVFAEFLND